MVNVQKAAVWAEDAKNVLIIDGYSSGRFYPQVLKNAGYTPYMLKSGLEKIPVFQEEFHTALLDASEYIKVFEPAKGILTDESDALDAFIQDIEKYHFQAVIPGCEGSVLLANQIAKRLGLPYNEGGISGALRNKYKMQQALAEKGLRHIRSIKTDDYQEVFDWMDELGLDKVVIKPLADGGSRAVYVCRSTAEIKAVFDEVLNMLDECNKVNSQLLVQEFIEGDEYILNHVSQGGRHYLTDVYKYIKEISPDGRPLYDAGLVLNPHDLELAELNDYTCAVLDALGLTSGPSHAEVKLTKNGPVLIEVGARLMGGIPSDPNYYPLWEPIVQFAALSYISNDTATEGKAQDARVVRSDASPEVPSIVPPAECMLMKFVISYEDRDVTNVLAEKLPQMLPTCLSADFENLKEKGHMVKTTTLATNVGNLYFMGSVHDVMRDYKIAKYLETEKAHLLFQRPEDKPDKNIKKVDESLDTVSSKTVEELERELKEETLRLLQE